MPSHSLNRKKQKSPKKSRRTPKRNNSPKLPKLSKSHHILFRGDHIYRPIFGAPYHHHGIYIGKNQVIHYQTPADESFWRIFRNFGPSGRIVQTSLEEFMGGYSLDQLKIVDYSHFHVATPNTIVRRAKSRLGEDLYDVLNRNCEHFTYWCVTGKERCAQIVETGRVVREIAEMVYPNVSKRINFPDMITPLKRKSRSKNNQSPPKRQYARRRSP